MISLTGGDVYPCQMYRGKGGLTHASICHARSIRVYSDAVFAEFLSFKSRFVKSVNTEEIPRKGIPAA
jgi:hypothetical protein